MCVREREETGIEGETERESVCEREREREETGIEGETERECVCVCV